MNTNTRTPRTSKSVRRAVPALAIVVLAIGLGACQTPPQGTVVAQAPAQLEVVPQGPAIQPMHIPPGVDTSLPADRIVEQLERAAAVSRGNEVHLPSWTDRIIAQLAHEAKVAQSPSARFGGMSADRIAEQLERDTQREKLQQRERAGAPEFY